MIERQAVAQIIGFQEPCIAAIGFQKAVTNKNKVCLSSVSYKSFIEKCLAVYEWYELNRHIIDCVILILIKHISYNFYNATTLLYVG